MSLPLAKDAHARRILKLMFRYIKLSLRVHSYPSIHNTPNEMLRELSDLESELDDLLY